MPTAPATAHLYSPIGLLALTGSDAGLHAVRFLEGPDAAAPTAPADVAECLRPAHAQLAAYFTGELRAFDLTCVPLTGTDFQRQVWGALAGIGHGRTLSYLEVAKLLGNPGAVRAVGAANGQNPISIICPCHRVIGANGAASLATRAAWCASAGSWLLSGRRRAGCLDNRMLGGQACRII